MPTKGSRSQRRDSFTAHEKLNAAQALTKSADVRSVIKDFYPQLSEDAYESRRKLVSRWLHEKSKLEAQCSVKKGSGKKKARPKGICTKLSREAEDELVKWVNDLRKEGVPISSKMLTLEAMYVAAEYDIQEFKASWRWQNAFKARHRLSMRARTRTGQKTPDDLSEIAAAFAVKVRAAMLDLGVYNADQFATLD